MTRRVAFLFALIGSFFTTRADAHGFAPRLLEIRERGDGIWETELRGAASEAPPEVHFPAQCVELSTDDGRAHVKLRCADLRGAEISAAGVDRRTELLVQVHFLDGTSANGSLHDETDRFLVPRVHEPPSAIGAWIVLGMRHIAFGFDHLLFVAALFFLVRSRASLIASLSAFTVAHSVTLALGVLGVVSLSPALAEALIALSVACLAAELARRREVHGAARRRGGAEEGCQAEGGEEGAPVGGLLSRGHVRAPRGGRWTAGSGCRSRSSGRCS